MGLFDYIELDEEIELPEFSGDPQDLDWQSKSIGRPVMITYKITSDGRLLEKKTEDRKLTDEEIQEKAEENGYESWEAWEESEGGFGPLESWKYTVDKEYWEDYNMHGSFEFHASGKRVDDYDDIYWSYEARFTNGDLDEIILLKKS